MLRKRLRQKFGHSLRTRNQFVDLEPRNFRLAMFVLFYEQPVYYQLFDANFLAVRAGVQR